MKRPPKVQRRKSRAGSAPAAALAPSPSILDSRPAIDVSAALIFRAGKLLIAQRHSHAHLGGLWEFPGGKREPAETFAQCLVREIREELGVEISVGRLFEEVVHAYPERIVHLKFFVSRLASGEPRPLGCEALRWVARSELADFQFPPADARLLEKLQKSLELWGIEPAISEGSRSNTAPANQQGKPTPRRKP